MDACAAVRRRSSSATSVLAVLITALIGAGCVDSPSLDPGASAAPEPKVDEGRVVRGIVVDEELRPISGAQISQLGGDANATTSSDGAFRLIGLPPLRDILLQARHAAYRSQTVSVNLEFVPEAEVRFVLPGGPTTAGYHITNITRGEITCQVAAGSHHGSPGFYKYSCEDLVSDATSLSDERVRVPVEPGVTVVIVELVWEPQSQAADVMGLTVYASTVEEELLIGSIHSFPGGHYISMKASTAALQSAKTRGGYIDSLVHVDPGTLDEHIPNAGIVVNQAFTLYTTAFYGEIPSPVWSALTEP
jgi:hypothetical protein